MTDLLLDWSFFVNHMNVKKNKYIDSNGDEIQINKFYSDSRLTYQTSYKNHIKHGKEIRYHLNGNVHYSMEYRNGMKNGLGQWYHEHGFLVHSIQYKNDKPYGVVKKYNYSFGTPEYMNRIFLNKKHGIQFSYE